MIEVKRVEPKTVAEMIRDMNDEDLNSFLFKFKISSITRFLERGGAGLADAGEQLKILHGQVEGTEGTEFGCIVAGFDEEVQHE